MDGQNVTTYGNDIVDINTGKIKIENVTGDIDIKVTTKKLEIKYTTIAVSKSNSSSNTSSENASSVDKGTPLYINIIAVLEGNKCTVVSATDNTKTVPYQVASNGKYTFKVSGTYNGKTISENKDVTVNQYKSQGGFVQYDAGDWTEEEINELKEQKLYMLNKEKTYNNKFNLNDANSGLNFTFGGFTYKGDAENEEDIESGNIITSRNQSVTPQSEYGTPRYSGWQILESKVENEKIYVTKIIHSGSPENFVYRTGGTGTTSGYSAEYLLSSGERQNNYKVYGSIKINYRKWDLYKDKTLNKMGYINDVHVMTYDEAYKITNKEIRKIDSIYFLSTACQSGLLYGVDKDGSIEGTYNKGFTGCLGIRPVVEMNEGVYIESGSGTESDPYILGIDKN